MKIIARIYTDFESKFGLPRQSQLVPGLCGKIVFEKQYRDRNAVRGLEDYSHLWIIWHFDGFGSPDGKWSPTVRPPRLGGNARMGVFATRSPNRPNPIALSCVKIEKIDLECADAPVIYVSGIDMQSASEIYDIKPYLPICDCIPDAKGGFSDERASHSLEVEISPEVSDGLEADTLDVIKQIVAQDIRPAYQTDGREYNFDYGRYSIGFTVKDGKANITKITEIGVNEE